MWPFKKRARHIDLSVGQVWTSGTQWFVIGSVDQFREHRVVSVSAYNDVEMRDPFAAHLPFSEETFRDQNSTLVFESGGILSRDFGEGFAQWHDAWHKGEAGVW